MTCGIFGPSLDICPTKEEITPQLIALLPRGRAWGRHDGGPFPGSVPYLFWSAVAHVLAYVNARICALRLEFWCATQKETTAQWLEEYGFPDGCQPYSTLCQKVAAQGGTRCDFYVAACAAQGWVIECVSLDANCGGLAGRAKAGCAKPGRRVLAGMTIKVHLAASAAYSGANVGRTQAGRAKAGRQLACPPDISGLVCLIERIAHAEILITYVVA